MTEVFRYTPLKVAIEALSREVAYKPESEYVKVRDSYERVLASDLLATDDLPRRATAHFDGFALSSADTATATKESPAVLAVSDDETRVGVVPKKALRLGGASKVATGGYLPTGADAVVAIEDVSTRGKRLYVPHPVAPGEHVYPKGADVRRGERVLSAGRTLMGQDLVLMTSLRCSKVAVFKKPRVGIIPTGSELTPRIENPPKGRVVESHSLLLARLAEEAGGLATTMPIVRDERRALTRAIREAFRGNDVVFTLAGSSVGEPDLVSSAIESLGSATLLVHGVRIHRGRVMGVAVVSGKPLVIHPGPIQGALNAFILFGYPLIRHHLGKGFEQPPSISLTTGGSWEATGRFKDFDQVVYLKLIRDSAASGGFVAIPSSAETEKASFLTSRNAYALLRGENARLEKGQFVDAHLLPGFSRLE